MLSRNILPCCFAIFIVFQLLLSSTTYYNFSQKAYADGLTQENLPPASVGNRKASLFVKVSPPILTTDSRQDAYMQFRLFDANNNQTIQHVTYEITVNKGTLLSFSSSSSSSSPSSSSSGQKPLLRDFFHAHNGLLTLKVQPSNGTLTVYGEQDPFQNAWVADPGGTINVKGPVLLEGGLYHFHIEIFSIDNDRNIFLPQNAPKFDSYLSVGDVYRNKWNYQNQVYNTTLISYYDKINNLNFDPSKKSFSWAMPFNWNLSRIQQQPIFVHEEMRLPKSWKGFGDSPRFNATVNGQTLSGRSVAIDPFSFPDAMVVHYLINKNDVIKLAQQQQQQQGQQQAANNNNNNNNDVMRFTLLTPSASAQQQQQIATSSDLVTNTGGIHAAVSWSPNPLKPKTQSNVNISFYDPVTSNPLSANDVKYDMVLLDKNGHTVTTKQNLVAKNATDTQIVTFPSNDIYQIQLEIKELLKAGQTPDLSRNGLARGYVVVPEFPNGVAILLIASIFTAVLIVQRKLPFYGK
ncbi:MAG: hypothetical protein ACJ72F_01540 [Nitrososphaeraceae archaeon]